MHIKNLYILLLIGPLCLNSINTYAEDGQNITANMLANEIESYLHEELSSKYSGRLEVQIKSFDHRIKLKPCSEQITYSIPYYNNNSQRVIVRVQCTNPYWNMHIPANLSVFRNVITTTKSLSKGETISKDNVNIQEKNIINLQQGYLESIDQVAGKITGQPLRQGYILTPNILSLPHIIKKGEIVKITSGNNGLYISMRGTALENGAIGDNIKIKNFTSNRTIEAIVLAAGTVEVPF